MSQPFFPETQAAPPDPILGLAETFRADNRDPKVNLTVGVYQNAQGETPVLASVKQAEYRLIQHEQSKGYLPIPGSPRFARQVQQLLLGDEHPLIASGRLSTFHTPGGTGALRLIADFVHAHGPQRQVWISQPTWPNHPGIFGSTGLRCQPYPYYDADSHQIDADAMIAALQKAQAGDLVIVHGCCHNPTGADLDTKGRARLVQLCAERGLVPVVDLAYQGFGTGLRDDAALITALAEADLNAFIAQSFSKNFGLYRERAGALTVITDSPDSAGRLGSQLKRAVRENYSNPPGHGGAIVETILDDPELTQSWKGELANMRLRLQRMRTLFHETAVAQTIDRDFSHLPRQQGMFSLTGLSKEEVTRLRDEHAIYLVGSGRINVAGLSEQNIPIVCEAIREVIG